MLKWFTIHDRDSHFWGGVMLSIWLIIGLSWMKNEFVMVWSTVPVVFVVACIWELWRKKKRSINLLFFKKELPASKPDMNDVWATMAGGIVIPVLYTFAKTILFFTNSL